MLRKRYSTSALTPPFISLFLTGLLATSLSLLIAPALVQSSPPTRDPHTPGYASAKELPDGSVPPVNVDGDFIIGPTHNPAVEISDRTGAPNSLPNGTVIEFTMNSSDSKIYPGIARDANTFGTVDPKDPAKLVVTTSHPAPYTRKVSVYVPKQYVAGSAAPFIIGADGPDWLLFSVLDTLIAQHKLPAMVAISIGNGSGDAQGSQRGLEYDTMSGVYAEFVEAPAKVLAQVKCVLSVIAEIVQVLPVEVTVKVSPSENVVVKVVLVPVTDALLEELVTVPGAKVLWFTWKLADGLLVLTPKKSFVVSASITSAVVVAFCTWNAVC